MIDRRSLLLTAAATALAPPAFAQASSPTELNALYDRFFR